ncbi:MAG: DUF2271 domain-containing protein [Marinospirillum sp.]|uniref:DUF2271 domain-containing protein n=1 Tax=Marinospirillum sp. TaxID=2183934 RepID=UPI0019FE5357|nr:DUF2271 domain-containing protein [Marinospirillum sp.]MBE0508589.1 DUF2271 domain-containing protein [Marinospirillum sp.]
MQKLISILSLLVIITLPVCVQAKEVSLTTQLNNYRGDGAYLSIYLTDSDGRYQQTLWVAGKKSKHYKHLLDWAKGSGMKRSEFDGLTGASVISGQALKITINLDDTLIDSGYQIRIDSAVEDMRDNRADVIAPLTTSGAGKPVNGRGYVRRFTYDF